MLSCRELTKKIASGDKPKSWREALEFKFHLFICKHCSNFKKQLESINENAKLYFLKFQKERKEKIENLKEKIKKQM